MSRLHLLPPAACPRPSALAGVAVALLLVLAQALLLQHQAEHLGTAAGSECPVCISGSALDHAAAEPVGTPPAAAGFSLPSAPAYASPRTATSRRANARDPPFPRTA